MASEKGLPPVGVDEQTSPAQTPNHRYHARGKRVFFWRRLFCVIGVILLVKMGLHILNFARSTRSSSGGDVVNPGVEDIKANDDSTFSRLSKIALPDSLQEFLRDHFSNTCENGADDSDHTAVEAVNTEGSELATSILSIAKRQENGNGTSSAPIDTPTPSDTPAPSDAPTPTPTDTPTSDTPITTPSETETPTVDTPTTEPTTTPTDSPDTPTTTTTMMVDTPTITPDTPTETSGTTESTPDTTSDTPSPTSSSVPGTSETSSSPGSTPVTSTSTTSVPSSSSIPATTPVSSSSSATATAATSSPMGSTLSTSTSQQTTSRTHVQTSTLPGGAVTTITSVEVVTQGGGGAGQQQQPTSTPGEEPSLQPGAAVPNMMKQPALEVLVGAVIGGMMLM